MKHGIGHEAARDAAFLYDLPVADGYALRVVYERVAPNTFAEVAYLRRPYEPVVAEIRVGTKTATDLVLAAREILAA